MTTLERVLALEDVDDERREVVRWRYERLRRAGYPARHARELAVRPDVDLHGAIELVRRGCPPDIARRILI